MTSACVIQLKIRSREGYFSIVSPDLPGLHVCGESTESALSSAVLAVKELFRRNRHIDVEVRPVASSIDSFPTVAPSFDRVVVQPAH
jgi:predicted RNase H-like HicB family nuclease